MEEKFTQGKPAGENGTQLNFDSIVRIEEINSNTYIHYTDDIIYKSAISIDELEWELPKDLFARVHPNHLINTKFAVKIITVNTKFIELKNGQKIPLSPELVNEKQLLESMRLPKKIQVFLRRIFTS